MSSTPETIKRVENFYDIKIAKIRIAELEAKVAGLEATLARVKELWKVIPTASPFDFVRLRQDIRDTLSRRPKEEA